MAGPGRSQTAAWAPSAPKTRPFRFGPELEPDPDPALAPGAVVGDRYRIVRLLGEGGMGRVYEAEHNYIHQRVALKLLRRDRQADAEHVARFEQEAYAASRVGDPAIVQVKDFGHVADGRAYMAMELLEGESLEDWMDRPGNLADALVWVAAIARGLNAAHDAKVVHRDIKPANIFLERVGPGEIRPRILDFGLAKVTTPEQTQVETQAGSLLGTPYYLAPERALGKPLDARTDLYSLGVIVYELLTGNVPFSDETFMGILGQHIKVHPLDPRQAAPDRGIPDDIALLAMRLLAKDPKQRPPSGAAVADEIDAIVERHGAQLAKVETGPRLDSLPPSESTVVLDQMAERSTEPPVARTGVTTHRLGSAEPEPMVEIPDAEDDGRRRPPIPWLLVAGITVAVGAAGVWAFGSDPPPASRPAAAPPQPAEPRAVVEPPPKPDATAVESAREPPPVPDAGPPNAVQRGGKTPGDDATAKRRPRKRRRKPAERPEAKQPADPDIPELKDNVYPDQ